MEVECVLLLSDHCEWIMPFYKSALSHPKWSAKSALSLASHKRKGAVKLYSARKELRSAVLSEVLNGTDHLRGVGVLVVVPGHDLNLIGVVVATLFFTIFSEFLHKFLSTVIVPDKTVVVVHSSLFYLSSFTLYRISHNKSSVFCPYFHFCIQYRGIK